VPTANGYDVLADNNTISVGSSTTYTHTSLNPNTPHTYKVRAKNAGGPGAWSEETSKATLPASPDIPVNLNALPQSTSITVTWGNVPGATNYDIEVDGKEVPNGPTTNYIHSSLMPGTHHIYRVRSINSGGKSDWSAPVSATTLQESSPVPANLKATASKTEVSLTWDAVNGASGYDIEVDGVTIDNNTKTSYTHTNLSPGSQHAYRVRSKKSGVNSNWSAAVTATTLTDSFGIPANFKAVENNTSITLSWSPVAGATGYDIEADGSENILDNGTSTTAVISGLQPKSRHSYRVRARSASEQSEWTQLLQTTTYALPTPVILSAISTETAINVLWSTTTASVVYDLEVDGTIVPDINGSSYNCSGLMPNTQHIFRLRSKSGTDASNWSIPYAKSTLSGSADAPYGLFAMIKNTAITVVWQPMNGAASYDLEVDGSVVGNITATKYNHSGLQPGTPHTYRVRAHIGTGASDWSPMINVQTTPNGPAVPTNIKTSSTTSRITVSWDQVNGAEEYDIEVDGVVNSIGSGTSYQHSGVTPGSEHKYRVRSKNTAGYYSSWSGLISETAKSSVMTYTVDCTSGEAINLVFAASEIQDLSQYTFTISYDSSKLDVIDLCAFTPNTDKLAAPIAGTDIQIIQVTSGTIVFKKTGSAQTSQLWSGAVNSILFQSKFDGQTNVTYSFQ
jgi:fibronectin type 3 domain-containing protein